MANTSRNGSKNGCYFSVIYIRKFALSNLGGRSWVCSSVGFKATAVDVPFLISVHLVLLIVFPASECKHQLLLTEIFRVPKQTESHVTAWAAGTAVRAREILPLRDPSAGSPDLLPPRHRQRETHHVNRHCCQEVTAPAQEPLLHPVLNTPPCKTACNYQYCWQHGSCEHLEAKAGPH